MTLKALIFGAGTTLVSVSSAYWQVEYERIHLERHYWSEGAAIGDLDADGHPDVVCGPHWFAGPDFTRHEIYPATRTFRTRPESGPPQVISGFPGELSGRSAYASDNFFSFIYDFNGDGWGDVLTFGMPNQPAVLYLNPRDREQHWARHVVLSHVDNESPTFVDLTGDGRPEIVCNHRGNFGYAEPDWENPTAPWRFISITREGQWPQFTHGLGVGDMNGDGGLDILFKDGWLEQPASLAGNPIWRWHRVPFALGGAQMFAYDVNGDGRTDVVTSLDAHGFGLVWHEQLGEDDEHGSPRFRSHQIMGVEASDNRYGVVFSEPHALELVDVDQDGRKDIVTGKCFWSHGPDGAPDGTQPAVLYWFRLDREPGGPVDWVPRLIDDNSGVGRQIGVGDVNGDGFPDFAIGNKKGVFLFRSRPARMTAEAWRAAQPPVRFRASSQSIDGPATRESLFSPRLAITRPGIFFVAKENASRHEIRIPIPQGRRYTRAEIRFRAIAPSFPGLALNSILELVSPGPEGHQGRYFAMQHTLLRADEKGIRTNIDNLVHGYSSTRTDVLEKVRKGGGASLAYRFVYDTAKGAVSVEIREMDTGEADVFTETRTNKGEVLVEEDSIRDHGAGLALRFGLDRSYDHGGYVPPYGWTFSDLVVELSSADAAGR